MAEMVGIAESVTPIVCATTLEAEVRELRLIAEHKPRYNRRSRYPERALWVKLTVEAVPPAVASCARSVTTAPATSARSARGGPPRPPSPRSTRSSRCASAPAAVARGRTTAVRPRRDGPLRRARAPARRAVERLRRRGRRGGRRARRRLAATSSPRCERGSAGWPTGALRGRRRRARPAARARPRGRARPAARAAGRRARARGGAAAPPTGGWEVVCRPPRPAGRHDDHVPRGADPMPYVDALRATAEVVAPRRGPAPGRDAEETEKILRWLETPGVRIVDLDGRVDLPGARRGAARAAPRAAGRRAARRGRLRRAGSVSVAGTGRTPARARVGLRGPTSRLRSTA